MRARGLKLSGPARNLQSPAVAPRADAWIETPSRPPPQHSRTVAPRAGAWIETRPLQTVSPGSSKPKTSCTIRVGLSNSTIIRMMCLSVLNSLFSPAGAISERKSIRRYFCSDYAQPFQKPSDFHVYKQRTQDVEQDQDSIATEVIQARIHLIRGRRAILDTDLASLSGVPTKRLNEQ